MSDDSAHFTKDMTIHERLVAILGELPAIGKDARNTQQNFMYRSHDAVLNALNPLLAKWGVFVAPRVLERAIGERTTGNDKTMYEVNLLVEYTFYGMKGDSVVASAWGEGTDMGDKSTNKAMTMAYKNVLAQVFAVSTEDTIDADGGSPQETTRVGHTAGEQGTAFPQAEFDPAVNKHPKALPLDGEFFARYHEQLLAVEPTVDWSLVFDMLGRKDAEEAGGDQRNRFWIRAANAAGRIEDLESFPPTDDQQIIDAFAWAFEGLALPMPLPRKAEAEEFPLPKPGDDVPFEEPADA